MKANITTLDAKENGTIELKDSVFGLEPRADILQRMVVYQLSRRQAGTHQTKTRSEINGTTRKSVRQKGSGGARHASRKANIFRGGGKAHGPVQRSHAKKLPRKFRSLALKHALSSKQKASELIVLEDASLKEPKTANLRKKFAKLKLNSALIIDGVELNPNFVLAARNIAHIDVLPIAGINVYDILRREKLVITKAALQALEARLA